METCRGLVDEKGQVIEAHCECCSVYPPPVWHYFFAGQIERPYARRYKRRNGYSRVCRRGSEQPWLTRDDAREEARRHGARAVFHFSEWAARKAAGLL